MNRGLRLEGLALQVRAYPADLLVKGQRRGSLGRISTARVTVYRVGGITKISGTGFARQAGVLADTAGVVWNGNTMSETKGRYDGTSSRLDSGRH